MDVTMPDGTVVQGVPDGITKSQLLDKYQRYSAPDQTSADPIRGAYQATMNTVAKPINNAVSDVMGAATSPIRYAAHPLASAIDSTGAGQWIGDKLMGASDAVSGAVAPAMANLKDLEGYNPDLAKDLSAFGQNVQLAGNMMAAKPLAEAALATSPAKAFLADESGMGIPTNAPKPVYNPVATHSAISDAYGAAKAATKPYYNLMNEIASGETADASSLKPALDSMISDIQNTPFHEASSELSYLKQQAAKIGEDGRIPLNDMVKLKQNLNSNFNPKRFAQGTDTPYANVSGIVDDSLKDAAKRIPDFAEAKSLADKNWLNTVKSPFEDNKILQKFWKPEDYYAKQSVENGLLEALPDPTLQRAQTMLGGIKSPIQLNAVRRVLPQELADTLSAAKIQDVTKGGGLSRFGAAGKAIVGAPNLTLGGIRNTFTNIGEAIGGVPLDQATKDLIESAKSPSPSLSTKYQQPFSDLKASLQQQKDLAGEMQPYGAPKPAPRPIEKLPPDVIAADRQAGMSPAGYAAMRQQELMAETANKANIRKAFEENSAWNQNKTMNEAARQQAVNNVHDQMQSPSWNKLTPKQKSDATKVLIRNEINRQLTVPEANTEIGSQMKGAFGMKNGGSVKKPSLTAQFLGRKYA